MAGFTTASAIIVTLAQATHLFGIPVTRFSGFASPLKTIGSIFQGKISKNIIFLILFSFQVSLEEWIYQLVSFLLSPFLFFTAQNSPQSSTKKNSKAIRFQLNFFWSSSRLWFAIFFQKIMKSSLLGMFQVVSRLQLFLLSGNIWAISCPVKISKENQL